MNGTEAGEEVEQTISQEEYERFKMWRDQQLAAGNNNNGNGDTPAAVSPPQEPAGLIPAPDIGDETFPEDDERAELDKDLESMRTRTEQRKEWNGSPGNLDIAETPGYDDQLISFLSSITADGTIPAQQRFVHDSQLTERAKRKLKLAELVLLDHEFSTTRIRNSTEFACMQDEFNLVMIMIPLGLTKYDITPEFLHSMQLLRTKWYAKINKSLGGWFLDKLRTNRSENISEDRSGGGQAGRDEQKERGITDRIRAVLQG